MPKPAVARVPHTVSRTWACGSGYQVAVAGGQPMERSSGSLTSRAPQWSSSFADIRSSLPRDKRDRVDTREQRATGRSGDGGRGFREAPPVGAELQAELRDAAGAEAVLGGHVQGAFAVHQVEDHSSVALAARGQPG